MNSPASFIDHTLLRPDCRAAEIADLCEEAVEYGFASVCVPPVYVPQAKKLLYGSDVATGTVVGFPLGYQTTATKVFEASNAIEAGAGEIDMVINLVAAQSGDLQLVEDDVCQVVAASGEALVKVIVECCLFGDALKRRLAQVVVAAGADYVKTSTGFAAAGATLEDVGLLASVANGQIGVKASGGIRDWSSCQQMLSAGATRIGTSSGVGIMKQWQKSVGIA